MEKIYAIVPLLSSIFVLCLGIWVLVKYFRDKREIELILALFCFAVTIWLFGTFMMFLSQTDAEAIFWDRFVYGGVVFVPVLMHHFSLVFAKIKKQKLFLILGYIFSFAFLVLSRTNLFVADLYKYQWGSHTKAEFFHHIFIILFFAYTVVFFINVWRYYNTEITSDEKNQSKYVFIAFLTLIILGAPAYLPAYGIPLPPFPFLSGLFFIIILSYSILKHHLLDIRVASATFLTVVLLIVFFVDIFLAKSSTETVFRVIAFAAMTVIGFYLIRSVNNEIRQKEKLQELSIQLAQANNHLKDLDKMKTEFVSLASHELLTPVSAIEGYLSMILDEKLAKIEDPKAQRFLDNVYKSSKRLARLIADMLNISRIEEGRLLVEKKDIDLGDLVRQVMDELKFKADEHKQKIIFENVAGAKYPTFTDPDKIKEVLVNLIGNSIKYTMQPGTITVSIEKVPTETVTKTWGELEAVIKAGTVDDQESIHAVADENMKMILGKEQYMIKVKDQGIGIPAEELPKLFKKFHRVGDFSTAESQGTGLGLYITRALVELHHGRVWPASEGQGKGSTFTFTLPTLDAKQLIIDQEAQSPKSDEQLKPLAKPMGNDTEL